MVATTSWTARADPALPVAVEVLRRGPLSRAELARRLGLSAGSLSRLSGPLLDRGILLDIGEHNDGRVGRPIRLLDVDASSRLFLGMKLREDEVIGALTDLRGNVVRIGALPLLDRAPERVVERITQLMSEIALGSTVTSAGIGIGGIVHSRRQVVDAPFLGWKDVPLADLVERAIDVPTLIDNDVAAFTEYEHWFGAGADDDRFAVVTLGVGTGFGLVANGSRIDGDDYGVGLVGHWPVVPFGPMCPAGHRGCAMTILGSDAIEKRASDAIGRPVTYEEILDLAQDGQPAARAIVRESGQGLGRLLAAIANLAMPQRIIIGGEGVRLAQVAQDDVLEAMRADRDPRAHTPPIVLTDGDNAEWCRGAAVLAIQAFVLGGLPNDRAS